MKASVEFSVFVILLHLNGYPVSGMSDEMKELAAMLHNTCVEETSVSEALIDKVNTEKIFEDDENLKCYIKCLMMQMACAHSKSHRKIQNAINAPHLVLLEKKQQKLDQQFDGKISDDGIIDEEATIAVLPEEIQAEAEPVIKKCGTKIGSSPCENAWLTHQCYAREKPDVYMLI